MGRVHAGASEIFVDEFDYSGVINAITIGITNPVSDITAFADTDVTFVAGKPGFSFTLNGLYDGAVAGYDSEMFADLTDSDRLITISPSIAAATGGVCLLGQGDITSRPTIASTADAVLLNVTWNGNKPLTRGKFAYVNALTDEGDPNSGDGINIGAVTSSLQMIIFQHVLYWDGNGELTTTIYSDDVSGFEGSKADRVVFSAIGAVGSERKVVTTTADTDSWWRAEFGWSSTVTAVSLIIGFGLAPQ